MPKSGPMSGAILWQDVYFCKFFELPKLNVGVGVTGVRVLKTDDAAKYVHHVTYFDCDVGFEPQQGPCGSSPGQVSRGADLIGRVRAPPSGDTPWGSESFAFALHTLAPHTSEAPHPCPRALRSAPDPPVGAS